MVLYQNYYPPTDQNDFHSRTHFNIGPFILKCSWLKLLSLLQPNLNTIVVYQNCGRHTRRPTNVSSIPADQPRRLPLFNIWPFGKFTWQSAKLSHLQPNFGVIFLNQNCVRLPTHQLRWPLQLNLVWKGLIGNSFEHFVISKYWANCNHTLVEWSTRVTNIGPYGKVCWYFPKIMFFTHTYQLCWLSQPTSSQNWSVL